MGAPDAGHFTLVANQLAKGDVVVFLGAGANRCGRPDDAQWRRDGFLPDGTELRDDLLENFGTPPSDSRELSHVAQYAALMAGDAPLHDRLKEIFGTPSTPNALHELLRDLRSVLESRGRYTRCPLIVTTNYDDLVERAFASADPAELLDVVYFAQREHRVGLFDRTRDGGPPQPIETKDELPFALEERTVLLKIHGIIADDSDCVLTENDYIDYLAVGDILDLMPVQLVDRLRNSNVLFLGYGMADWNIRALLQRIKLGQRRGFKSWAVRRGAGEFEEKLWLTRDVVTYDIGLDAYVERLRATLADLPPKEPA